MLRYDDQRLDYSALLRESRSLDDSHCTQTVRVAVLSDSAPQLLTPLFKTLLSLNAVRAEVYEVYGSAELEVLDPQSGLYAFAPDVVVIANATFGLRQSFYSRSDRRASFVSDQMEACASAWAACRERTNATIIQTNYVIPHDKLFGSYDFQVGSSFAAAVARLNQRLVEQAHCTAGVFICDVDHLAAYHGRKHWLDEKMWLLSAAFCAFEYLPHSVQSVVDIMLSLRGEGVKCVVLDLDNTLWGGIIGEDGLDGIRIGHLGDGEAYTHFQHFLLALKERGILLAVCSKNNPETALQPFRGHPEMVLKEHDIVAFLANWESKAENITHISETLNLSLRSMVFVDDNPAERGIVREALPDVIVPELPEDPAEYVRCLAELNLFEATSHSSLDAERTDLYRVDAQRKLAGRTFSSPEDHLRSLEMRVDCRRFEPFHLPRVVQLLQRSNQFNLQTRRYSLAQCEAFMRDDTKWLPICVSLRDKYGDVGIISVVIASLETKTLAIEEWVMSCRVLARGVEQFAMNFIVESARTRGIDVVTGRYVPTEKNRMVKDFFAGFGFRKVQESASGATDWEIQTSAYRAGIHFIDVDIAGAAHAAR